MIGLSSWKAMQLRINLGLAVSIALVAAISVSPSSFSPSLDPGTREVEDHGVRSLQHGMDQHGAPFGATEETAHDLAKPWANPHPLHLLDQLGGR